MRIPSDDYIQIDDLDELDFENYDEETEEDENQEEEEEYDIEIGFSKRILNIKPITNLNLASNYHILNNISQILLRFKKKIFRITLTH